VPAVPEEVLVTPERLVPEMNEAQLDRYVLACAENLIAHPMPRAGETPSLEYRLAEAFFRGAHTRRRRALVEREGR
jgi:hypothetical protein